MRNALVLSAGGVWGAFQAGALSVVLKEKEYAPEGIFGSSAGALNGAFLANSAGKSKGPVNWPCIGDELVNFWKENITSPGVLWKARDSIDLGDFKGLLQTEADPPGPGPNNPPLFWDIVREQIKPSNLRAARENGVYYSPGTVDLFAGDIVYPEVSDANIVDLIIASTAIPVLMDSRDIPRGSKTHSFVDGGTRDVAPVTRAIQNNYENIACIVCQSKKVKQLQEPDFRPRDLEQLLPRLMNIIVNETVNNDLWTIALLKDLLKRSNLKRQELNDRHKGYYDLKCATVIRPEKEIDVDDMAFNAQDIENMIQHGIDIATKVLQKRKVFASLNDALEKSGVFGSFIVCWDSSEKPR
jgi:NTE family protein